MSSKIRVGIIGLSVSSKATNWGGTAHVPYLLSDQGKKHYEIVALCNTSVESGKKSIKEYKLPSTTATYASPSDLAKDPNVDLVVNVTGVQHHYDALLPIVEAGKNVYTELPLASNMEQVKDLVSRAEQKGVKTAFGMQGQTLPLTALLKDVIGQGKIGKVLSSTWTGAAGPFSEKPEPVGNKYMLERKTGANMMSVWFLHCKLHIPSVRVLEAPTYLYARLTLPSPAINYICAALGEVDTFHSILGNQRPSVNLTDDSGKVVDTTQKDTPDQIMFTGRLTNGTLLSYHLRGGAPFPNQPGVVWSIYGEKGEIRITNPMALLDIVPAGIKIEMQVFGQEGVQELKVGEDEMAGLEHPCQNVGRIYEAFARGEVGTWPDWRLALKRHELMEEMWRRSDGEGAFGEGVRGM